MRIAKNNLVYPLLRDTCSLLGSSKCEVMSVLDLKDAFHSLQLSEKIPEVLWNSSIFWQCIIFISEDAYGIECFPTHMANVH